MDISATVNVGNELNGIPGRKFRPPPYTTTSFGTTYIFYYILVVLKIQNFSEGTERMINGWGIGKVKTMLANRLHH
jgi:hypothetical protein